MFGEIFYLPSCQGLYLRNMACFKMQAGKWISLKTVGWSSSLVTWAVRVFFFNCIGVGIWTSAGDVILFTTSGIWWQKEYCCNSFWLKYTSIDPKFRQLLCGTHAKWVKAVYGRLNSQSCFLYLLTAVTETHKQTDQLLLECCGAGSSFAGRLLDRTVQTDLCLVLSKPGV